MLYSTFINVRIGALYWPAPHPGPHPRPCHHGLEVGDHDPALHPRPVQQPRQGGGLVRGHADVEAAAGPELGPEVEQLQLPGPRQQRRLGRGVHLGADDLVAAESLPGLATCGVMKYIYLHDFVEKHHELIYHALTLTILSKAATTRIKYLNPAILPPRLSRLYNSRPSHEEER